MNWFANKKVLVPFDFSDESHLAVDAALEMASNENIQVLHVAPNLAVTSPEVIWDSKTDVTRRSSIEACFQKEFSDDRYRDLKFHVSFGDAGHGIASFAKEFDADVIVMPTHGRTGLKHLLIGSVAERVVRLSHCPVLILRK